MNSFPQSDSDAVFKNIFGSSARKGGGRPAAPLSRKKVDSPSENQEQEPPLAGPDPEESQSKADEKPKVVLKNLAWAVDKATMNESVKIQLEAEVPESLADITRVEIQLLALTPDGTREKIDKKDFYLKNGKATGEVTLYYPQYREEGNLLAICDYVFAAKHRNSEVAESGRIKASQPFAMHLRWDKAEEWFGKAVKLQATTCLKDGSEAMLKVASENGVAVEEKVKAKKGKFEFNWVPCLCGVATDAEGAFPEKVEFFAELAYGEEKAAPEKNFHMKVIAKTAAHQFSRDYTWGRFGVHAEFNQRIEMGTIDVEVKRTMMKAWAGALVNMENAGFTGEVQGCPWEGRRWGRIQGRGDIPNQYHDGKAWQPMPKGYVPEVDDISYWGFIPFGAKYAIGGYSVAVWPEKFGDYDFNKSSYVKKRKDWKQDTESRWSHRFVVRPHHCKKGTKPGGCGYPLGLRFEMKEVKTWQADTIAVCKGNFRSNAGCFSLEDWDIKMVAHEVGHLVGMPDEYDGGGVDPNVQGDGAVNGLDYDSVMGTSMNLVKKRHYLNFSKVTETMVSGKIGTTLAFQAADE